MNAVMEKKTQAPKRTAVETILLAAATFEGEFTKWELAVAAWKLDPNKFGMRGFEALYPDMNRVLMELVGSKQTNPVKRGLLEMPFPTYYRVTEKGKGQAKLLGAAEVSKADDMANRLYSSLTVYIEHPAFIRWRANPSEPDKISDARDYLAIHSGLDGARRIVAAARDWCTRSGVDLIVWFSNSSYSRRPPIHVSILSELDDFLTALSHRFPALNAYPKARRA